MEILINILFDMQCIHECVHLKAVVQIERFQIVSIFNLDANTHGTIKITESSEITFVVHILYLTRILMSHFH